jgi:hypothetical protein
MTIMGVSKFQRFFRAVAELDVKREDLKRYSDFINHKLHDLLLRAQATAKANGRDVIHPIDLPITKGLQESIQRYRRTDQDVAISDILEQLALLPPMELAYGYDVREELPSVVGGLSVALAQAFKVLDPKSHTPHSADWDRSFRLFDLLL